MFDPLKIISDFAKKPELLSNAFRAPLSLKEEMLLKGLDRDLADCVSAILEKALAGEVLINLSAQQQQSVREMNAVRRVIRDILIKKGWGGATMNFSN